MGFNYHHNHRRRRFRRRRRKPRMTVRSLARKVRSLEIETKPERKFLDDDTAADYINLTSASINTNVLNNIAQGTGENQRIGDKVKLTSIQLDYWFTAVARAGVTTTAATPCNVLTRFILVWFPGVGEGTASDIDIRNVLESSVTTPLQVQSFYKRNGQVNYRVLHDKTYEHEFTNFPYYDGSTAITNSIFPLANSSHHCRITVPLNHHATYDDAAGTVVKGTLVWYALATPDVASSEQVERTVVSRLTWEDE